MHEVDVRAAPKRFLSFDLTALASTAAAARITRHFSMLFRIPSVTFVMFLSRCSNDVHVEFCIVLYDGTGTENIVSVSMRALEMRYVFIC